MFRREEEPETIILKAARDDDGDTPPIEYKENKKTRQRREQMRRINDWLASAPVSFDCERGSLIRFDKHGFLIDPNRRTLCRHFNNGRWDHGGRLFGGFWMNMAREDRFKIMRISGQRIANVDYGQLFPRLAYVRALAAQPDSDIYDIAGDGSARAGWKKLINALLFAQSPLRQWPNETREQFPAGTKLRDLVQAVKERHAPIAHLLETGIGFNLMHIESEMLIAIIGALFKRGIAALPLHDSVLVAASQADAARGTMRAAFEQATGVPCGFVEVQVMPDL